MRQAVMVDWPVLDRLFAGFVTHRRAKVLPWLLARADDGDALGCRVVLEGVVEVVLLPLRAGFSGGNPRSRVVAGSGEGGAPASLASWGLALDVPPARGTSGFRWWLAAASLRLRLGGARQSDRCGCRSGGSGFRLALRSSPPCWVSAMVARVTWSSTRLGRGNRSGVDGFGFFLLALRTSTPCCVGCGC